MTKEEKELLLRDLSARLPYGVKMLHSEELPGWFSKEYGKGTSTFIFTLTYDSFTYTITELDRVKPYLRPMSSITEEEKNELRQEHVKDEKLYAECLTKAANGDNSMRGKVIPHFAADWCNKNHFDYRGLIPMGLALEATEGMY